MPAPARCSGGALPGVYINFSQAVVGGTLYVDTLDDAAYAFRLPA